MKVLAAIKESLLHGEARLLECSICGENDRRKLIVEDIGICVGICGCNYSFCKKCWTSEKLGKNLLKTLGYKKIKIKDEMLTLKKVRKI